MAGDILTFVLWFFLNAKGLKKKVSLSTLKPEQRHGSKLCGCSNIHRTWGRGRGEGVGICVAGVGRRGEQF